MDIRPIAHIHNDMPQKFGIPRQSGLVPELVSVITFEEGFRDPAFLQGLDGFEYIWLLWLFENEKGQISPTVRPPRLGGNTHMGVFATRSPFRPNPVGLSSVRLISVHTSAHKQEDEEGGRYLLPFIKVGGADLRDGTGIIDIKPYLPYTDSHPGAAAGFTDKAKPCLLKVKIDNALLSQIPADKRKALLGILARDPRPGYHDDPERIYGITFGTRNIRFRVCDDELEVISADRI